MFPLKRAGQISRSRLRGFYFAKERKEPIWQAVCQRKERAGPASCLQGKERAGLASCLPKNGKSRSDKLFDKEMKLRYSDVYMKRSFPLCMEITGLPCFLAVLAQSDE